MDSGDEVRAHLNTLHETVWELAAIALALRDPATTDPVQRRAAERVLVEAGLTETGMDITVCHYPPGTSKWNKIEHRLFSFITKNWRGRPLTSYRVVVELIAATTTNSGLKIFAEWDQGYYPAGVRVTDAELAAVPIKPHKWHGEWNYTIAPGTSLTIK